MKKAVSLLLIFVLLFSISSCKVAETPKENAYNYENEIRAVWISIYDMAQLRGLGENGFRVKADKMFSEIASWNFNTVFVQVRPSGDALYPSEIFPWSKYIMSYNMTPPDYDPMKIMIDIAHEHSLEFHAWINPYRVQGTSNDVSALSEDNPAKKMLEKSKNDVYISDSAIYYNPASAKVRKLLLDGVREIVNRYDVDGIHIDDYFYPTTDEKIDCVQYNEYKENESYLSLKSWRQEQINAFVSGMYRAVKAVDKSIIVSISPSADIEKNLSAFYADVKLWSEESGYADWIIPQIYFGFKNENSPFRSSVKEWKELVTNKNIKLIIGLAGYKAGNFDSYAGSGKREWENSSDILSRQLTYLRENGCYGFSIFSYKSISAPNKAMKTEWESFKNEMSATVSSTSLTN